MREFGIITSVDSGNCVVRFDRKAACDKCNMCLRGKNEMYVELVVANSLAAKVGDKVEVEMPDNTILKASFLVYIVPAASFLIALAVTQGMEDWVSASIAIGALALTYLGIAVFEKYLRKKKGLIPKMITLIKMEDDANEGQCSSIE